MLRSLVGSEMCIRDRKIDNVRSYAFPVVAIALCIGVLTYSVLQQRAQGTQLLLGLHPVLEVRHYSFSLVAVLCAFAWRRLDWLGFDLLFKPFVVLAPISYAIYISHLPLMADANYLQTISSSILRWVGYLICVFLFSYFVEIYVYRYLRKKIRL